MQRAARKLFLTLMAPVVALVALIGFAAAPAQAATWGSCDQWGNWTSGNYTVYNNIWGSGAGTQCAWANSGSNFGVWAQHPNTGGIKSYPNSTRYVGRTISSLASLTSSYNVTVPSSGAYNTAYDVWDTGKTKEIMLWMNYNGAVGPLGSSVGNLTLGGHTWTVYVGNNGSNDVYSFLRTSDSNSGTVNILSILNWLKNTKGYIGNFTVGDVQLGWEITSSSAGLDFRANSYSVSYS